MAAKSGAIPGTVPPLLGFVAGYIDGCAFLALYGFFAAQVTGSFVIAGAELVTHEHGVVAKLAAIPAFMAGAALAVVTVAASRRLRLPPLPVGLGLEALALAVFMVSGLAGAAIDDPDAVLNLTAALSAAAAMGIQAAVVRLLMGGVPQTNVMTGNSTQLAIDLAELGILWLRRWRRPDDAGVAHEFTATRRRTGAMALLVGGFLVGAAVGATAYAVAGLWCVLLALAIILALIIWAIRRRE